MEESSKLTPLATPPPLRFASPNSVQNRRHPDRIRFLIRSHGHEVQHLDSPATGFQERPKQRPVVERAKAARAFMRDQARGLRAERNRIVGRFRDTVSKKARDQITSEPSASFSKHRRKSSADGRGEFVPAAGLVVFLTKLVE